MVHSLPTPADLAKQSAIFRHFVELSKIPRPSRHEAAVCEYLKQWAARHGLECRQDRKGNVVIKRPGSAGGENAPTVVIQGHVDMVTEKNEETAHDFLKDPIRLQVKAHDKEGCDLWLHATDTTLGSDNGIGVCAALAMLEQPTSFKLPPLECLFTVEEEIGLHGASELEPGMVSDKARYLLNLDSEEWGQLTIGCAGGGDTLITLPVEHEDASGFTAMELKVEGLKGGHSGLNIHEYRGNAIQLVVRALQTALAKAPHCRVASIKGGDKHNAIPRQCGAVLLVKRGEEQTVRECIASSAAVFKHEFGKMEPNMAVALTESTATHSRALSSSSSSRLLTMLRLFPHGVVKMSHELAGVPETSNNLAKVCITADGNAYEVLASSRSFIGESLEAARYELKLLAETFSASRVLQKPSYPGWAPNSSSKLLDITKKIMQEVSGREPEIVALHAGLECGILAEKIPGLDMVSFGPTIHGAHSPDEACEIGTVEPFSQVVVKTLQAIADMK